MPPQQQPEENTAEKETKLEKQVQQQQNKHRIKTHSKEIEVVTIKSEQNDASVQNERIHIKEELQCTAAETGEVFSL